MSKTRKLDTVNLGGGRYTPFTHTKRAQFSPSNWVKPPCRTLSWSVGVGRDTNNSKARVGPEELVVFLAFGGEPDSLTHMQNVLRPPDQAEEGRKEGGDLGVGERNTPHGRLGFQGESNRSALVLSK